MTNLYRPTLQGGISTALILSEARSAQPKDLGILPVAARTTAADNHITRAACTTPRDTANAANSAFAVPSHLITGVAQ